MQEHRQGRENTEKRRRRRRRRRKKGVWNGRMIAVVSVLALCVIGIIVGAVFLFSGSDEEAEKPSIEAEAEGNTEAEETQKEERTGEEGDPQSAENLLTEEQGAETDLAALLTAGNVRETEEITMGIDVSRFQGTIDWKQAAGAGVDFAMIRVGYRNQTTGEITADSTAKYNMQEATANGIRIGAYFFSTAVSEEEAIEEARWTADYISQYAVTYPVAYNCEGFENPDSRQYGLSKTERTDFAAAFLNEIYNRGYTPMFYASKNELEGEAKWETARLAEQFRIWVSQYPAAPYPETETSSYSGVHAMWQYTNNGIVAGVPEPVDVNVAYFGYETSAEAQNQEAPDRVEADVEALLNFRETDETVTAKDVVNLRDKPGQGADSTVLRELVNGETAQRTGVSDSGWSRLILDGERYYAVSSYLTTDLSYRPPAEEPDDGLKTKFTAVSERVTPKIEVNLRVLPSVTNPEAVVAATVTAGEVFVRTGINKEYGWSRVEYNGQTLYCVSSYLQMAE